MDQLKQQLAGVAKYGFWILCSVTVIGALGVGFWATSNLKKDRDTQIASLDSAKSSMQTIRNQLSTHPNDKTRDEMETLLDRLKEDVRASWESQYARQKDILVWPVQELKQDFVNAFEGYEPIELTLEFPVPPEKTVQVGLLNRYRDYIGDVLPQIAEIAGAKWTADITKAASGYGGGGMGLAGGGMPGMGDGEGGYGGMGPGGGLGGGLPGMPGAGGDQGMPAEDQPLVRWDNSSQETVLTNLFPWRGKDPNTLDVLYSQENLWVLRQLMEVIASVNGDAKLPFQATIRQINEIAIGKAATQGIAAGEGAGLIGPGVAAGSFDPASSGGSGMPGGEGGEGGAEAEATDPADQRYVDVNYEPIDAATLRSALASSSPEDAPLAVAKRIPVKMNLKIDQRKIPLLVAECGNAPLMIEVRQVRINPSASQTAGYGGGGMGPGGMPGAGSGGGMGMGGGLGGDEGEGGGGGMGPGGMGGGNVARSEFPNDVTVEVFGIVYIYNPPDIEKLGIEQVDENTVLDGDTETLSGESVASEPSATTEPAADTTEPTEPATQPGGEEPAGAPPIDAGDTTTPPDNSGQPAGGPTAAPGVAPDAGGTTAGPAPGTASPPTPAGSPDPNAAGAGQPDPSGAPQPAGPPQPAGTGTP